MTKFILSLAVLAFGLAVSSGNASAQTTTCNGELTPGTYINVQVPAGVECDVDPGVIVTGNLIVAQDATLNAGCEEEFETVSPAEKRPLNCLIVHGNINATNAAVISLSGPGVSVGGNATLTATRAVVDIEAVTVSGNIIVTNSTGKAIELTGNSSSSLKVTGSTTAETFVEQNDVTGNMVFNNNTAKLVNIIAGNTIAGSLNCPGNLPPPTNRGLTNTVSGTETGQCVGL